MIPNASTSILEIVEDWMLSPPRRLVVGSGSYVRALAFVLGAEWVDPEILAESPRIMEEEGVPQVLADLKQVVLVGGSSGNALEMLFWHEEVWTWVEGLSPLGDQHELAFLWVSPPRQDIHWIQVVSLGLGLPPEDLASGQCGHVILRMDAPLEILCKTLSNIRPSDLPPLRARKTADTRRQALAQLRHAVLNGVPEKIDAAAKQVLNVFQGSEYLMDVFCRPPSHANGNQLRRWLNDHVTPGVTRDNTEADSHNILAWLAESF